jgi:hypothetical protein
MKSNKLTHVHVYIIGVVIMTIVGVALYFMLLKPLNEEVVSLTGQVAAKEAEAVDVDGKKFVWNQLEGAQKALVEAQTRKAGKEAQLASLERKKQLPSAQTLRIATTQPEILATTMPRWLMLPERVVQTMENWSKARAKRYNVEAVTTFAAKAPSTDPTKIPTDVVAWNLGTMTVTGKFDQVMQWAKDWNNAPLVAAVNDLKCSIADRGGKIKATASLNVYIFPTGPGAGKAVSVAGAGGPGGAPGSFGGGMGNGPGGPGGMTGAPGGVSAPMNGP